ncbi:MAG: thiamine phosphate synthase [Gammaproteobacteria bacterium]|nr:thiamine phosphate synthase [Gammaproteobacteria bacterium]
MVKLGSNHKIHGIYAITDPDLISEHDLIAKVQAAIDGGISVLQYRNKKATPLQQEQQAQLLRHICQQHQVTFIINDNVELALKIKADGVHLGKKDGSIKKARERLGQQAIIGISCYNEIGRAIEAQEAGADYIAFGRFFSSKTKPEAVQANTNLIKQAKVKLEIPIVAIGGINLTNIKQLTDLSVDATAIIHDIFSQKDIESHCHKLKNFFNF